MNSAGYYSVECWGGATFDASLRFLKEDPWERLRKLRNGFKNTKLQMLFRGQNILGYRPYADDVVDYFVEKSVANGIDINLMGNKGAKIACFIDEPQVISLAEQRRITRAEIAVDYGLAINGPKLMVVGSAPAAINRMIRRRQHEPMSDVCVLAASTGFASVVQLKERLMDSDLTSIVVRGKKGGIPVTIAIINAILREIAKSSGKAK